MDDVSAFARGIAPLQWDWRDGANASDLGKGRVMRNWDQPTNFDKVPRDIFLSWGPQEKEIETYFFFFGWVGWGSAYFQEGNEFFSLEYIESILQDKFNTVKFVSVPASDVPVNCVRFPASATANNFYYIKLVALATDGTYNDVKNVTLASVKKRLENKYDPVPEGQILDVVVPAGGKDRNAFENSFKPKKKSFLKPDFRLI